MYSRTTYDVSKNKPSLILKLHYIIYLLIIHYLCKTNIQVGIYLLKVNNRNARTRCDMLAEKLSAYARIKICAISRDWPTYAVVSILNMLQTRMDFPSPWAKAVFVICFTLALESTGLGSKTMKYFISGFSRNFLPPIKRVRSFDLPNFFRFSYRDFRNFFKTLK